MPRKKPVDPAPLQVIEDNGVIIAEVRDETCWIMSRGAHKTRQYHLDRLNPLLNWAVEKYFGFDKEGNRSAPPDTEFMQSASKFSAEYQKSEYAPIDGTDDSSIRKKLYKDVQQHITALERALKKMS